MIALALRSLNARRTSFASTFLSLVLAAALIGSFASLIESGTQPGLANGDQETLIVMGLVVGSWGALIALFSLTSTLGIAIRQRDVEIGLLRTIGTTPRQARRMIRFETAALAVVGTALGAAVAWAGGAALLGLLRSNGAVSPTVEYVGGPLPLASTAVGLTLVSLLAASIAGRRTTSGPARLAIAEGESGLAPMRRWRVVIGIVLVAQGIGMGVVTLTVTRNSTDPYAPMQTAGTAAIVASIGLAALAPVLLRWAALVLRPLLLLGGAPSQLAAFNASRRAALLSGALGPVIVFTATTAGVLMLVGIDGRTLAAIVPDQQEAHTITLLNYVITGMIALFAAIMVLNALVAVTHQRRGEFDRLRLAGATPDQVRRSVSVEGGLVAVVGVVLGLLAATVTVVPYSVARHEGVVPDGQLWVPVLVALMAALLTVGGSGVAVRRTLARSRR